MEEPKRGFLPRRRNERVLIALATALASFLAAPEVLALVRALSTLISSYTGL